MEKQGSMEAYTSFFAKRRRIVDYFIVLYCVVLDWYHSTSRSIIGVMVAWLMASWLRECRDEDDIGLIIFLWF